MLCLGWHISAQEQNYEKRVAPLDSLGFYLTIIMIYSCQNVVFEKCTETTVCSD